MHASESLFPHNKPVMKYICDKSKMINILVHSSIDDAEFSKYQHTLQDMYNYEFIFRIFISYKELKKELKQSVVFLSPT
jgi:hypothetical protein